MLKESIQYTIFRSRLNKRFLEVNSTVLNIDYMNSGANSIILVIIHSTVCNGLEICNQFELVQTIPRIHI